MFPIAVVVYTWEEHNQAFEYFKRYVDPLDLSRLDNSVLTKDAMYPLCVIADSSGVKEAPARYMIQLRGAFRVTLDTLNAMAHIIKPSTPNDFKLEMPEETALGGDKFEIRLSNEQAKTVAYCLFLAWFSPQILKWGLSFNPKPFMEIYEMVENLYPNIFPSSFMLSEASKTSIEYTFKRIVDSDAVGKNTTNTIISIKGNNADEYSLNSDSPYIAKSRMDSLFRTTLSSLKPSSDLYSEMKFGKAYSKIYEMMRSLGVNNHIYDSWTNLNQSDIQSFMNCLTLVRENSLVFKK